MLLRAATVDDLPFLGRMARGLDPPRRPRHARRRRRRRPARRRLFSPATYGFVDEHTPILAIAVDEPHRNRGLGAALLAALATAARATGVPALSLSVSPRNPALRLYERLGFRRVATLPNAQLVLRLPL